MTTSKGPWSYDAESGLVLTKDRAGDWTATSPYCATEVCSVNPLDGISNGDLISAAPEMRDALRAFRRYEESMAASDMVTALIAYQDLASLAYPALAKAER